LVQIYLEAILVATLKRKCKSKVLAVHAYISTKIDICYYFEIRNLDLLTMTLSGMSCNSESHLRIT